MKKSVLFWLYFVVAIVFAIYFCVRIVLSGMGYGPVAKVRNISISADKTDADLSMLVQAASITPNTNAYSVDLDALNNRILNVPEIKKSAVRRMPNGNLSVKVSLRRAVALWTNGQNFYPLSVDGKPIDKPTDVRDDSYVLFRGKLPSDISEITNAAHNLVNYLDYMEWIEDRRWNMYTNNDVIIMLPEQNPVDAIAALITLNSNHGILDKDISVIDMRDSARILVK